MKPLPRMFWTIIGWIGVALAILAICVAVIDGVPAVFLLYAALLVGGVSGVGVNSTARYGLVILAISALLVLGMTGITRDSQGSGVVAPSLASLLGLFAIVGIPLAVSAGLLAWGTVRRSSRPG